MTDQEIISTMREAYIYAIPLIMMDLTFQNSTNVTEGTGAPLNQFYHVKAFPTHEDKLVVRLNVDTLYSIACMDLSAEPLVFQKPRTDRYCSIAVYDAYTNCQAILGTGGMDDGEAAEYLLCGPSYTGDIPEGIEQIALPTDMAWMIVRTECANHDDLAAVSDIQEQFALMPLSEIDNPDYVFPQGSYAAENDFVPFEKIQEMSVETFFNRFNELAAANPGTDEDIPALERFAKIGVGPSLTFLADQFSPVIQKALVLFPKMVMGELLRSSRDGDKGYFHLVNGWLYMADNIARFGTDYEFRAIIALMGFGANPVEMAIYPSTQTDSNGKPLDGSNEYVFHFEPNSFPPNNGFWSLTAYDIDGFLIENPLGKYAIRDKNGLVTNEDGSIDVYLQAESPGKTLEANWLPIVSEPFQLTLRIYLPKESVFDLEWKPPFVTKV